MFYKLLLNQLGGLGAAALTLNQLAAEQGRDPVFLFRGPKPEFNPNYRLTPAPRFVWSWRKGIRLTEVYFQDLVSGDEFTLRP